MDQQQEKLEALGPAERIIAALTSFQDHLVHNRTGIVRADGRRNIGTVWEPAIWRDEGGEKIVYKPVKVGKKTDFQRVGKMNGDMEVKNGNRIMGSFRAAGLYPEAAVYLYKQVAEVWKIDNEFAARWASWAFPREHRDLKVVLCAFMLVQSRFGDAIIEDGEVLFYDDDFRAVGEAMCLLRAKADLNPKLLLRVGQLLELPEIAAINRDLGFGKSSRKPYLGRYKRVVTKWLRYREENLPLLEGLVKAGFTQTVRKLTRKVNYKPTSAKFFEILKWKQKQAADGRRELAIGVEIEKDTWEHLSEEDICNIIEQDEPNWKRIVGMLPANVGMTRAIVACAVEAGCMSNADLIILTPTLEELGLLEVASVKKIWKKAIDQAENQRAANIAKNVKSKEAKEGLQEAADKATEKAFEKVTRGLRVYCIIDRSSSMEGALERGQRYLTKFLGGFPLDRLHVSVFNTMGTELKIKSPKAAAVQQAFKGVGAGGGTDYSQGIRALAHHLPKEDEDALMIFVGDQADQHGGLQRFVRTVQTSGINPVALGMMTVVAPGWPRGRVVEHAAMELGIPCFDISEEMFESDDPYAVTRILQNLIATTPVGERPAGRPAPKRKSLVEEILATNLLVKPVWA